MILVVCNSSRVHKRHAFASRLSIMVLEGKNGEFATPVHTIVETHSYTQAATRIYNISNFCNPKDK